MSWRLRDSIAALPLPPTPKLVLAAVASYCRDDGTPGWPSVARLAGDTGLHPRTVRRALRALEELGHLVTVASRGHHSNRYRVILYPGALPPLPGRSARVYPGALPPEPVIEPGIEPETPLDAAVAAPPSGSAGPEPARPPRPLPNPRDNGGSPMSPSAPKPFASEAQALAADWWESRWPRPIGNFVAARSRVREALEAGWSEEAVARALATFGYSPTRADLTRKLEIQHKIADQRGYEGLLDYEHNAKSVDNDWSRPDDGPGQW